MTVEKIQKQSVRLKWTPSCLRNLSLKPERENFAFSKFTKQEQLA